MDRQTSLEVLGGYIHTYKFSEGVEDEVVLDLVYEARDIDQRLGSEDKIDAWFEAKTKELNDWQRDELKKHWGTLQIVLSQERETPREYLDRESHYVWGKRYLLKVVEEHAGPKVQLKHSKIILQVGPGTNRERKQATVAPVISRTNQGRHA